MEIFSVNSHLNTIMARMRTLEFCFNNIQLVLLTTFIIHPLLMHGDLTYDKHDLGVYIPPEKSKLYHRPRWLLNEIEWFQYQGILEHTAFHAKGDNIIFHSLLKVFLIFSIRI